MRLEIAGDAAVPALPRIVSEGWTVAHLEPLHRPTVLYVGGYPQGSLGTPGCLNLAASDVFVLIGWTFAGADYLPAAGRSAGDHVHELRRLSGLTWDQLADVFGVTRRTMHLWANGKPMTVSHEAKLHRVLASLYKADRGEARLNRTALLSARQDRETALDLLAQSRFEEAEAILGRGPARPARKPMVPLSPEARAARQPPRPVDLIDAQRDVVHQEDGRLVRALSRQLKRPT